MMDFCAFRQGFCFVDLIKEFESSLPTHYKIDVCNLSVVESFSPVVAKAI